MLTPLDINLVSVLIAAIAGFIIGAVWYSPALFAKTYEKLLKEKMGKGKSFPVLLAVNFISLLATAFVLAHSIKGSGASTIVDALIIGTLTWAGFIFFTTVLGGVMWDNKPAKMAAITGGYWLLTINAMAIILTIMP